jgi:hypothetical protein
VISALSHHGESGLILYRQRDHDCAGDEDSVSRRARRKSRPEPSEYIMPSEIREKPLPTPHPDYSHAPRSADRSERAKPGGLEKSEEFDRDEPAHDSHPDDLDLMLTKQITEPDPALGSDETFGAQDRSRGNDVTIPTFLEEKKDQPGTAEVFEAVRSGSDEIVPRQAGWGARMRARLAGGFARVQSGASRTSDDVEPHGLGTWTSLLLLSYASALTLGLAWLLWTGRAFRSAPATESSAKRKGVDQSSKAAEPRLRQDLPAIPAENQTSVGKAITIGDVEITPLLIQLAPVDLVRSIDAGDFHHEETNSLVLRFRLKNVSKMHTLAPLARSLVRDQLSALDRSFVATASGDNIGLYPLAVESEWVILGQEFPVLKPGESAETLVASEPVNEDRLAESMTWRILLRIGPYRTDMLGVQFSKSELSQ